MIQTSPVKTLTLDEQRARTEKVLRVRRKLEEIIIKVNYHFNSGFERHVNLQTPESIFLNFLKKMMTVEVAAQYLHRIGKRDFQLTMHEHMVECLTFMSLSDKHDWGQLNDKLALLKDATREIDFDELKSKSHTLDKYYQVSDKLINNIRDFKFPDITT